MGLHVHLVDDHKLFRQGLKLLIENIDQVGKISESSNGHEFLEALANDVPDLVLIDIEMPILNGIDATKAALQLNPDLKIIALSMYGDQDYYYQMIESGVKGFVIKNSDFNEVKKAILTVLDNNNYFSEELLYSLIKNIRTHKNGISENVISEREKDILIEICRGLSNQEIAEKLQISKRTVDKHRCNILLKTGSKNTASLVIYAIKNRLIRI